MTDNDCYLRWTTNEWTTDATTSGTSTTPNWGATGGQIVIDDASATYYSTEIHMPSGIDFQVRTYDQKRIGPRLYFKFVKSKFNRTQLKKIKNRMAVLTTLIENAEKMGQHAFHEDLCKRLIIAVKESEIYACGYDQWVEEKYINKFMRYVKLEEEYDQKIIYFRELEEYPRPIPRKVQKIIEDVQEKKLFDKLHVLYLDYTEDKTPEEKKIKSTKKKIKEKDPILFGTLEYQEDKFYYITDWIDKVCDLTLDKIIDSINVDPNTIPEIDEDYVKAIQRSMRRKKKRLDITKPKNFKRLMKSEDKDRKK